MGQSESIDQLAAALVAAQAEMGHAKKESENPHFRSRYADLASVRDAVAEPLAHHGLGVVQTLVPRAEPLLSDSLQVLGDLRTVMLHSSGQWIDGAQPIAGDWASPQKIGGAITYARRYGLAAICGIAQDDDDGASAAPLARYERPARRAAPAQSAPAQRTEQPFDEFDGGADDADESCRRLADRETRQEINRTFPQNGQPAVSEPPANPPSGAGKKLYVYVKKGNHWEWFGRFAARQKPPLDAKNISNWSDKWARYAYREHQAALAATTNGDGGH